MTLNEFVTSHGIQLDCLPTVMKRRWSCLFYFAQTEDHLPQPETFTCCYTASSDELPTAVEVLGWLAGDARTALSLRTFEDWAEDLGINPDSRREEQHYQEVKRRNAQLKRWLGVQAFRKLLASGDSVEG